MEQGIKAKPVTPASGEVSDVHIGVAGCLPLAPDQQGFLGRQQSGTGPKLLLAGQNNAVVNV